MVFEFHDTVRSNFWHPQGIHFTAKFGIGTPPHLKRVSDALPNCRGPRPNRWRALLGRNVGKELIFYFFGMNWSSNARIWFDATFGTHRGAILLQNSESAHHHIRNVSLLPYQIAVGLDPID